MRIKCIKTMNYKSITVGKEYDIGYTSTYSSFYTIKNDNGNAYAYEKECFEIVKEEEKMKKVKCTSLGNNVLIEVGKVYDVERENENAYFIRIQSNYGSEIIDYKKELFVECEKEYTLGEMVKEYESEFVGQFKRICDGKKLEWRRDGVLIWSDNRLEFGITQFALTQKYTKVEDLEVTYIGALKELEAGKETYCIYEDNKTNYDSSSRAISLEKLYKGKWYIKA